MRYVSGKAKREKDKETEKTGMERTEQLKRKGKTKRDKQERN